MSDATVRGGCHCGAVRFRASGPTLWVAHCHCSDCRRAHGAAFVTWAGFRQEQVAVEPGARAPRWYASSPGARRAFCPVCGSPMFFESTRWPGETHVARALIEAELDKAPSAHVFWESHVDWLDGADGLPRKLSQAAQAKQAAQASAAEGPADPGKA
jgi:hypothetical protein